MSKLTGKVRHRTNWRGKLILQVEEEFNTDGDWPSPSRTYTEWRDATVSDVVIDVKNANLINNV